ncbi:MAG: hypothetical protein JW734_05905 [Candidatus Omnitrophica bacterium]|nr:hypothetical protein [Candidatus Omnitrophota bacterium]
MLINKTEPIVSEKEKDFPAGQNLDNIKDNIKSNIQNNGLKNEKLKFSILVRCSRINSCNWSMLMFI